MTMTTSRCPRRMRRRVSAPGLYGMRGAARDWEDESTFKMTTEGVLEVRPHVSCPLR